MLINPHPPGNRGEEDIKVIVQMPLNLGYLAALTPRDEWEVDVIDEAIEPAIDENGNLNFDADLVGITATDLRWHYSHRFDAKKLAEKPNEIPPELVNTILIGKSMDYDIIKTYPSTTASAAVEG